MSATHKSGATKSSKKGTPAKGKTDKSPAPQKQLKECHICECPLFEPYPTCSFCKKGACSDHLRKLRKYPHKQAANLEKKRSDNKSNMQPICDQCQDEYLVHQAMQLPQFAEQLKVIQQTESLLTKNQQEISQKTQQVKERLQAKELKHTTIMQQNVVVIDVGAKVQEMAEVEAQILRDEEALDQHTKLIEEATIQLENLEAEPFVTQQEDCKILDAESAKLTKELLKLDKGLSDLQQNIKKIESQMIQAFDNWEKNQIDKKKRAAGNQDKSCVLF